MLESSAAGQQGSLLWEPLVPFREELYLLQTEHQRSSTLHLVHLPAPVDRLFDDVSKTVIVLKTEKEIDVIFLGLQALQQVLASVQHGLFHGDQRPQPQRGELLTEIVSERWVCCFHRF